MYELVDLAEGEAPCPSCDDVAVVEQDGAYRWFVCTCGYEFGWEQMETTTVALDREGSCAIGVPAELRRRASAGMESALRSDREGPIDLGLTIPTRRAK